MKTKIIHLTGIGINEIGLSIEIEGIIYSGCLSEDVEEWIEEI